MSEMKKPENLLAEIAYSQKRVHATYYKGGKFTHADELAWFLSAGLTDDEVKYALLRELDRLLQGQKCGVIVQAARTSDSDTVVQVYKLPDHCKHHRVFAGSDDYFFMDAWLRTALNSADVVHAFTPSATASVPLTPKEWVNMFVGSTPVLPVRRPEAEDLASYAKAATQTKRDEEDVRDPTDHIPALRGVIALARGDYATVSPEDLNAAVDAGYVHPDVLAAVADEIAYATEAAVEGARDQGWSKGYDDGYDARTESGQRHKRTVCTDEDGELAVWDRRGKRDSDDRD